MTDFPGESHELVAEQPIPNSALSWSPGGYSPHITLRANASKDGQERISVLHLNLEPEDALNLHTGLLQALLFRSERLQQAEKELFRLHQTLAEIRDAARKATMGMPDAAALGMILQSAEAALLT